MKMTNMLVDVVGIPTVRLGLEGTAACGYAGAPSGGQQHVGILARREWERAAGVLALAPRPKTSDQPTNKQFRVPPCPDEISP